MKKKMRKFSEGGFESTMGKNSMIDEDTRARGMRSVMPDDSPAGTSTYGEENESPVTVTKTKTSVTAPTKPKFDMEAERARMDSLVKKQALEPVHPEDYVPGAGMLKPMLRKVVEMGAKRTAKEAAEGAAKNVARKAEEGFNPAEALDALKNRSVDAAKNRVAKNDAAETAVRTRANKAQSEANDIAEAKVRLRAAKVNDGASKSVRARAKKVVDGMKSGGTVRSSASRRADGCAIRGKTRA